MKILVAGGSGFVGGALCAALLEAQCHVTVLSRRPAPAGRSFEPAFDTLTWDPARPDPGAAWVQRLGEVDAVVNLAGENIAGSGRVPARWSPAFKARLRNSRVQATWAIVQGLAATPAERRPRVLVNASAIGYYGDRGDELLTEESPRGSGFFADLCRDWEANAMAATGPGVRVVCLRTGMVLEHGSMASDLLVLASRIGAGGPLGPGSQWWSWIHRADVVGLIQYALENETVDGALNVVAPTPRQMADFPRVLGQLLRRPSLLPTPAFALRLALGELADALLLSSQRAAPEKALNAGYRFTYPTLEEAFAAVVQSSG
jgi:uncharacterized protein (TIGR01777 family)